MSDQDQPVRAAATVIIVRDRPGGSADVLMLERSATMAFGPGAVVFPGGAVDDEDRALAASFDHGLDLDEAAARVAAIRETLEECGMGIGFTSPPDGAILSRMRAALVAGDPFIRMVRSLDITLDLHQLIPFARWQPPEDRRIARIFDTRFYIAKAPADQHPVADGGENVGFFWGAPERILRRDDMGGVRTLFPTRRNLERLAGYGDFAALAVHAAATPVIKIMPWVEQRDGQDCLCIPTDCGYPVTHEPLATALRG